MSMKPTYEELEQMVKKLEMNDMAQHYLDIAGVIMVVINADQKVSLINKKGCEILGYEEDDIIGQNWFDKFTPKNIRGHVKKIFNKLIEGEVELAEYFENPVLTKAGKERIIAWHNTILRDDEGNIISTLSSGTDITERKQAENALRKAHSELERKVQERTDELTKINKQLEQEIITRKKTEKLHRDNEEKYRLIFDKAPIGIFHYNNKGIITACNSKYLEINGSSYESTIKFNMLENLTDKKMLNVVRASLSGKRSLFTGEYTTILGKKNIQVHADFVPIFSDRKTVASGVCVIEDITEKVKAEDELKKSHDRLRELSHYLQSSRERERTRIAREVHDDLGQLLTAIKLDLSRLKTKIHKNQKELIKKTGATIDLVDMTLKSVKRIISELRPGVLDDLGLVAAIEWQTKDFKNRTGIEVKLEVNPSEFDLGNNLSTTIYRIYQETLTNIARHSKATVAKIVLTKKDSSIELTISDNGLGISDEQIADNNSFGILGIRERVKTFNGKLEIFSPPGKGTTVAITIPDK